MAGRESIACKVAREYCAKFPDAPSRTVARALHEQRPRLFPSVDRARDYVRKVRGNYGNRARKNSGDKSLYRENGSAGVVLLPTFIEEPWVPLEIDGPAVVAVFCDLHVPYTSKFALEIAVRESLKYKPTHVVLNGDVFDFHRGSRFDHQPESLEMTEEIEMGVQLLRWLMSKFPKARMIFKEGNHDERWSRWLSEGGSMVLRSLPSLKLEAMLAHEFDRQLGKKDGEKTDSLRPYGWDYVGDRRHIKAGLLPIMHGHELGIKSSVQPARAAMNKLHHSCLIGHLHQTDSHGRQNQIAGERGAWSVGCLSGLTPMWNRAASFNNGFAIVEVDGDGEYNVHNHRISPDGKVRAS